MAQFQGPYNKCPVCALESTDQKYCPIHGCETLHLPPERTCPHCGAWVRYVDAVFCATCGEALA